MAVRQVAIRVKPEGEAEVKRMFAETGKSGQASQEQVAGAVDKTNAAVDRQAEKWKRLAQLAKDTEAAQIKNAEISRRLGIGGGSAGSARTSASVFEEAFEAEERRKRGGITRLESSSRLNLSRQASDVFVTGAMGMNPAMIAIQQGPQILDAWATSGIKVTAQMAALWSTVAAGAVVIGGVAVAVDRYEASMNSLTVTTRGLGAATGVSAEKIMDIGRAVARGGQMSASSARELSETYVQTGRIGSKVLADLVGVTRGWAVTTKQDVNSASAELAKAFAEPAKGAADLNAKLNFLRPAELDHIRNLDEAGKRAEAQAFMVDKLKGSILDASAATGFWARGFENLKKTAEEYLEVAGRIAASATGMENPEARLAELMKRRAIAEYDPLGIKGDDKWVLSREIDTLERQIDLNRRAPQIRAANDTRAFVDRLRPQIEERRKLTAEIARAELLLKDPAALRNANVSRDDVAAGLKEKKAALDALNSGFKSASAAEAAAAKAQREAAKSTKQDAEDRNRAIQIGNEMVNAAMERERGVRDLMLAQERRLLEARGESIAHLERQAEFEERIAAYKRTGVTDQEAYNRALKETVDLVAAEATGRSKVKGLVPAETSLAKAEAIFGDGFEGRLRARFEGLKGPIANAIDGGFRAVNYRESFGRGVREAFLQSILQSLSDRAIRFAVNGLFGENDKGGLLGAIAKGGGSGGSGGWVQQAIQTGIRLFGRNADGTDNWRGGLTLTGERGPELRWEPPGTRILSNRNTMALLSGRGGGDNIVDLRGAVFGSGVSMEDVTAAVKEGMRQAVQEANSQAGPAALNYLDRNRILKKP